MDKIVSFLLLGDWGFPGINQTTVANQMAQYAWHNPIQFVIALGDNFYLNGVSNDTDIQWNQTYTNVYHAGSLQIPWYALLGNHDYHQNPQAQIDYYINKRDNRWNMPDYRYHVNYTINSVNNTSIDIIFLNTPILCPTETGETDIGGKYEVSKSMMDEEYQKVEEMLRESNATWLIVVGHYTIYSMAEHGDNPTLINKLVPLFQKYGVQAYINGHDHVLQAIEWKGIQYITSGSAAWPDATHPEGAGSFPINKQSIAKDGLLFHSTSLGFLTAAASSQTFTLQFIDYTGTKLYTSVLTNPRLLGSKYYDPKTKAIELIITYVIPIFGLFFGISFFLIICFTVRFYLKTKYNIHRRTVDQYIPVSFNPLASEWHEDNNPHELLLGGSISHFNEDDELDDGFDIEIADKDNSDDDENDTFVNVLSTERDDRRPSQDLERHLRNVL